MYVAICALAVAIDVPVLCGAPRAVVMVIWSTIWLPSHANLRRGLVNLIFPVLPRHMCTHVMIRVFLPKHMLYGHFYSLVTVHTIRMLRVIGYFCIPFGTHCIDISPSLPSPSQPLVKFRSSFYFEERDEPKTDKNLRPLPGSKVGGVSVCHLVLCFGAVCMCIVEHNTLHRVPPSDFAHVGSYK